MSYFGAAPTGNFISTASQRVTGSTNNYVDLDHAISALSDVIVLVNSVKQDITNLTFTSASRITLGGTLVSSDVVEIIYIGKSVATQTPGTSTVTNDMLAGSIALDKLSATGTKSSSTFLRGDNSFATVSTDINTPYAARMYGSANQSIATGTHVALDFASEVFDKGGIADVSTDRMTVPSDGAGLWWMSAAVQVNNFRCQRNILNFFINGSTTAGVSTGDNFENGQWDTGGQYSTSTGAVLFNLSAGDYVTAHFFHNDSSTQNVVNRNFTAWYLGPSS